MCKCVCIVDKLTPFLFLNECLLMEEKTLSYPLVEILQCSILRCQQRACVVVLSSHEDTVYGFLLLSACTMFWCTVLCTVLTVRAYRKTCVGVCSIKMYSAYPRHVSTHLPHEMG